MVLKELIAKGVLPLLSRPAIGRFMVQLVRERCAILMLHRFAWYSEGARGHDVNELRSTLASLRASGVRFIGLEEAIRESFEDQRTASRAPAIAVTVDDGYRDFMLMGLPVFEEFECPVTCFVVPEVIDGKSWFWWDRLDWSLRRLPTHELSLALAGEQVRFSRAGVNTDASVRRPLVSQLKRVPETERMAFLDALEVAAGSSRPALPPDEYRVMGWDDIRSCEQRGVMFGAHSLSHPVLSQCDDSRREAEILGSIQRVAKEVARPSRVFCYPYGLVDDFGPPDFRILGNASVEYAVSAEPGTLRPGAGPLSRHDPRRWSIPRFAYDGRAGMTARQLFL
jgi:peptidoglycan/xylan/chitin deacetylase (PgdA/CDA1 family)